MLNDFLLKNWFDLMQTVFIVGGFILSIMAIRNDNRSRKIEHLFELNQSYRDLWSKTYSHPELLRIRETKLDLNVNPITEIERRMVREVILHIYVVYEAIKSGQLNQDEIEKDINDFLSLPIPNAIWQEVRVYQNREFVHYIDNVLAE